MATTKPDYTYKWASDGDKIAPSNSKIQTGWSPEIPPYQWENWIQNRQDEMLAHINERGIAEWDNKTDYIAGKSYVQGSDGKVYKSVTASGPTTTVQDPVTDSTDTYWTIAFADVGAFGLGGQNVNISNTDLNALTKTGFYMGNTLVNAPLASTGWFYVLHQEHNASYSSQIAIDVGSSTPKTYQRQKAGGIWYSWYEVWNSSTLPVTAFAKTLLDDANAAAARGTLGAVSSTDVDAKFTGTNVSLAANGYQRLPSGLIIQWVTGSAFAANGTDSSQAVTFPITFPNAVFSCVVSMNIASSTNSADVWFQLYGTSVTGTFVQKQASAGAGVNVTQTPKIIAIGY